MYINKNAIIIADMVATLCVKTRMYAGSDKVNGISSFNRDLICELTNDGCHEDYPEVYRAITNILKD